MFVGAVLPPQPAMKRETDDTSATSKEKRRRAVMRKREPFHAVDEQILSRNAVLTLSMALRDVESQIVVQHPALIMLRPLPRQLLRRWCEVAAVEASRGVFQIIKATCVFSMKLMRWIARLSKRVL